MRYICTDGEYEVELEASSAKQAARFYVDGGEWGEHAKTTWVKVYVLADGALEDEEVKVPIHPSEPPCLDEEGHQWETPFSIVGGTEEQPGVFGHGGGVHMIEVCMRCACGRHTKTWDNDPQDGEEGVRSLEYRRGEYAEKLAAI